MSKCKDCGAPMKELLTSMYCTAECDLKKDDYGTDNGGFTCHDQPIWGKGLVETFIPLQVTPTYEEPEAIQWESSQVVLPDGTAEKPSPYYSFKNDQGYFYPGPSIEISTGGTSSVKWCEEPDYESVSLDIHGVDPGVEVQIAIYSTLTAVRHATVSRAGSGKVEVPLKRMKKVPLAVGQYLAQYVDVCLHADGYKVGQFTLAVGRTQQVLMVKDRSIE